MSPRRHRCVLIRHGETLWSRERRHTGRTDLPLLPDGEVQAEGLAPRLRGWEFSLILCSPMTRARRTAELAGLTGAEVDPDLLEWDYGDYEGRTTVDIRTGRPGWNLFDDGVPGGETLEQVTERVDRVIERVLAQPGDVACVAHAHLLRVMAVRWVGLGPGAARYLTLRPISVSVLGWEREQPVVERWNS